MSPALRQDLTLLEFVAASARAAADGRLVLDVVAGTLLALGLTIWRPIGWMSLTGAALCLAAFGVWGITDRELRERPQGSRSAIVRMLRGARAAATLVGGLAALTALFAGLGVVLGTWIS